jgi:hypothetical protein
MFETSSSEGSLIRNLFFLKAQTWKMIFTNGGGGGKQINLKFHKTSDFVHNLILVCGALDIHSKTFLLANSSHSKQFDVW